MFVCCVELGHSFSVEGISGGSETLVLVVFVVERVVRSDSRASVRGLSTLVSVH